MLEKSIKSSRAMDRCTESADEVIAALYRDSETHCCKKACNKQFDEFCLTSLLTISVS